MLSYYGFMVFVFFILTIIGIFINVPVGTIISVFMMIVYLLKFLEELED